LASLIARRAERLPAPARQLLHALVVWGDDATLDELARLLPPSSDLTSALDLLERAQLATVSGGFLRVAHPFLRRVILSVMPAERKRELCASCLEFRLDAPLELRAKYSIHAGGALEALSVLDALATRRASHGDLDGAVSALHHALDLARRELHRGELDDPSTAVLVFSRRLAEALGASERWTDADGVLREALGNAAPTSEHRAQLLSLLARVAHARRHTGEARRYLDEAIRVARQSDAHGLLPILERLDRAIDVA
jgi:tetratricopeptide (TPR) repeat protein